MRVRLTENGTVPEAFAETNGVKKGCTSFSVMLMDVYSDERPEIGIAYRTDGHLLNRRRLQALSHISTIIVHDLLFADNCALDTVSEADVQASMDLFAPGCVKFGLTTNMDKTVVMHQPPSNAAYGVPRIPVNVTQLRTVDNFTHLVSTLSRCIEIYNDVARQIFKGSQALRRLQNSPWNSHSLRLNIKLKMYKAVVLIKLFDGAETWTVYRKKSSDTQSLPHQFSPPDTKAEVSRQDLRHGSLGTD
ncbi:hypothetical protein SprV_0200741800 [Sparganum proliferum]